MHSSASHTRDGWFVNTDTTWHSGPCKGIIAARDIGGILKHHLVKNAIVASRLDICHQILDLYSQGKQQMPHHTPHQLQQPPSLQPTPPVPPVPPSQPPPGPEPPQPPQKDSQQPAQQPPPPPAQPPKKPSPQPSPPRQAKRTVVSAPAQHQVAGSPRQPPPPHPPSVFPLLRIAQNCSLAVCISLGSWTAGVVEGRPLGARAAPSFSTAVAMPGPEAAGVGVSPGCWWRAVSVRFLPTAGGSPVGQVGQQAPLTTVPTAGGGRSTHCSEKLVLLSDLKGKEEGGRNDLSDALVCSAGSSQS